MIMEKERITDYEELKQQLNALRERIDASTQISDSMIRKAIGRNMDSLRIRGILSVAVCVAALILVELILVSFGVSTLFLVVTAAFLGVNVWRFRNENQEDVIFPGVKSGGYGKTGGQVQERQ